MSEITAERAEYLAQEMIQCGSFTLAYDAHVEVAAALRKLDELLRASTWQPIETAPRDGTMIIGMELGRIAFMTCVNGGWWDTNTHRANRANPTRWMPAPMPESPKESA